MTLLQIDTNKQPITHGDTKMHKRNIFTKELEDKSRSIPFILIRFQILSAEKELSPRQHVYILLIHPAACTGRA